MTAHSAAHVRGERERWQRALGHVARRHEIILGRVPDELDGQDLLECELERAALASALDGALAMRDEALMGATSAAGAAAVASVRDRGSVELRVADAPRLFPARSPLLTPGFWLAAWGAAQVTRDGAALSALAVPRLLQRLGEVGDGFWTPLARALSAFGLGDPAADLAALLAEAQAAASGPGPTIVGPGYLTHRVLPLLGLAVQVVGGNQDRVDEACAAAVHRHDEWFRADERRFDPMGLLALPLLGVAARAHDLGLQVRVDSGYLPLDLVRGSVVAPGDAVRYHYPPARLHRSEEANWFLDLEGFPRAGRSHLLTERDGRLWASYTARGAPGLSEAVLRVEPPPLRTAIDPGPDDLLDIGELVLAADLLSRRAEDEELPLAERRAWLDEAADCLAEISGRLARTGSGPDALLFTDRGRAAYRAERGRFDPERLAAVEGTWRSRVARWDEEITAGAARESAHGSATVLRLQLDGILRAIVADRTGAAARQLRPQPDDYPKIFVPAAVDAARSRYEAFWDEPLELRYPSSPRARILTQVAPAGMLADDNELSWAFPGGYRSIARHLVPERIWVTWKYLTPGRSSGLAYDGLVWCDDHWAWLPRPYRVLRDLD